MIAITANSSKNNTHFHRFFLLLLGLTILAGCSKLPTYTSYPTQKISTGSGPEDMVLDTFTNRMQPRLLVSCNARRKTEAPHGEIWAVDLQSEQSAIFPRKGEPQNLAFNPHGIDIVKRGDGSIHLYVVNHLDSANRQLVMEYLVKENHLQYVAHFEHTILTSPNDVCFDPRGGFYWSNDASSRKNTFIEPVFRIKGGFVGHQSSSAQWSKSRNKFAYTNGIGVWNNDLYISTIIQSKVFRFRNQDISSKPELICKLKGGDNISFLPDGNLLVTAHLKQIKFLRHRNDMQIKSPSVVYLVNPNTGEKKSVYSDSGQTISAASTAIWYDGHLYVCQVFDGFIIKAKTGIL